MHAITMLMLRTVAAMTLPHLPRPITTATVGVQRYVARDSVRMQLRMPADASAVDALIERTKSVDMVAVLYFTDPQAFAQPEWAAEPSWGAPQPSARDDLVARVATTYAESAANGGRPLMVLQIDRDQPGMDTICAKRGVVSFPLLQLWSRGVAETLDAAALEARLLEIGVVARAEASGKRSGAAVAGGVTSGPGRGEVDFFGVSTSGGSQLTRSAIARAARNEPPVTPRLPEGISPEPQPEASEVGEAVPVEAVGMSESSGAKNEAVDRALDALFAEPCFDDVDDLPPPI